MEHGQNVLNALSKLKDRRTAVSQSAKALIETGGGNLFRVDLFTIGAAKRTVSLAAGFDLLVRAYNLVCARSLIRMQLDTTLRFSALSLVADPDAFADAVLSDERIDKLVDRDGKQLRDAYLVEKLTHVAPWIPEVYKRTSGYVHLSGQHIFSSVQAMDHEQRTIVMLVGEEDRQFPEWSWLEMINCFEASVAMFVGQLRAWEDIKKGGNHGAHINTTTV